MNDHLSHTLFPLKPIQLQASFPPPRCFGQRSAAAPPFAQLSGGEKTIPHPYGVQKSNGINLIISFIIA